MSQSPLHSVEDKKFNTVVYGIKERPPRTAKPTFYEAKLPIITDSIRDCFRLGKYKPDAQCPRPILIKSLRSADASLVISKVSSLKPPVHIKPDLTPREKKIENYLHKERWSLIQLGFERPGIKTNGSESRGQERAKRITKNKTRDELLCVFYTSERFHNMTS